MKIKTLALFVMAVALGWAVGLGSGPVPVPFIGAAGQAKSGRPLPRIFDSVLPEVKAKSRVAVLLPTELPFGEAKHAVVGKAEGSEYVISLYSEVGIAHAGFLALFAAYVSPDYHPRRSPVDQEVKLARGLRGLFMPVSCGGSCAPANLRWGQSGVVYEIQLSLPSTLGESDQEKTIVAVADSAILAGPR